MTGARHAAANPVPGTLKTTFWLLRLVGLLLLVAAVILSTIGLLGGIGYLAIAGTDTQAWVAFGLAGVFVLGAALAERGRGRTYQAWLAASMVANAAGSLLSALAERHGRAASQLHTMSLLGRVLGDVGTVCICLAVLYLVRTSALPWLRQRRAASRAQ
jgi:hypothetical protein